MNSISKEILLGALHWRYATKKFDSTRRIPNEVWAVLEHALVLSPSSFGLQPWKFIVVTNAELKKSLAQHSWKQSQPADCSHHVVFTVRKGYSPADVERFIARTSEVRGAPADSLTGYKNIILGSIKEAAESGRLDPWMTHQVYIALGQFMASAALLGIDTCPMEGIATSEYDKVLGLTTSGYATVVACAAGYRAPDDKYGTLAKVRYPLGDVIERR